MFESIFKLLEVPRHSMRPYSTSHAHFNGGKYLLSKKEYIYIYAVCTEKNNDKTRLLYISIYIDFYYWVDEFNTVII